MPGPASSDGLRAFAEAHAIPLSQSTDLPATAGIFARSDAKVQTCASGALPGGLDGQLLYFTYTTSDNDNHTTLHEMTLVVTRIPESIGYAPYLAFSGRSSPISIRSSGTSTRTIDLGEDDAIKGASASVFEGTDQSWITQLFSPALVEWLSRSSDDFGFELISGLFVAARPGQIATQAELETLCTDAAHVAEAIRRESLEEVESGTSGGAVAENVDAAKARPRLDMALSQVNLAESPADVRSAVGPFRRMILKSPVTWIGLVLKSWIWLLVLNIPGIAIPLLLIHDGRWGLLAAIEGAVFALIYLLVFRSHLRKNSAEYANEAFYRAYAGDRGLELIDPLKFAAVSAEANLPFTPERVLSGQIDGRRAGALLVSGDGTKREDRIALVAGPKGPVASSELRASPAGLSATDLDKFASGLTASLTAEAPVAVS